MSSSLRYVAVLVLGTVAIAYGCGSDEDDDGSTSATASTSSSSSGSGAASSSSSTGDTGAVGGGGAGATGGGGAGGMGGDTGGIGGGGPCSVDEDCGTNTDCQIFACNAGTCELANKVVGTITATQVGGDCKQDECDGMGGIVSVNLGTDIFDDDNDCTSDTCENGTPQNTPLLASAACTDGGGKLCDGNGACVECLAGADCTSLVCDAAQHVCVAPSCMDLVKNGTESDVDCGSTCPTCADGKQCGAASDCDSGVCTGGICQVPTCTDNVENGTETDVDCGSSCPDKCGWNQGCTVDTDCIGGKCSGSTCLPTCTDGEKNGNEGDIDCGGTELNCNACTVGQTCNVGADCIDGVCGGMPTLTCQAPTCSDLIENGNETDVDCGGTCAANCAVGKGCNANADCVTNLCTNNICAMP